MIYVLLLATFISVIAARYYSNKARYWEQVAKNQKEMMKKWWYSNDNT